MKTTGRRISAALLTISCMGFAPARAQDSAPAVPDVVDLPAVLRLARDVGIAAVHRMPRLKRLFMRRAMGLA